MKFILSFLFLSFILTSCVKSKNNASGFYEVKTEKTKACKYILHVKYKIKNIKDGYKTYYFPGLIKPNELFLPSSGGGICVGKDKTGYMISYGISDITSRGFIFYIDFKTINDKKKKPYFDEKFYLQYNVNKTVKSNRYQIDFTWESPTPSATNNTTGEKDGAEEI